MIRFAEPATINALSATELYEKLLRNEPLFILDVRNPDDFKRLRIEGQSALTTLNLPYYEFIEDEDGASARIPSDREVLVVCAKEGSSEYVAELLQARGIAASILLGGFASWGNHYDVRDVVQAPWGRIVQIARPARGDLSFAIVSEGQAALVDPLRHTEVYHEVVAEARATISHLLDTHVHADHISGGPALARETGAPYFVHPYDAIHPIDMLPARIDYSPLGFEQQFQVGSVTVTAHWFPGHTLGQFNFRLDAPDGSSALFTGDGIFLRSFGRPDLGGQAEAWTPLLYESLTERLPRLAEADTLILPAHFSSLAEAGEDGRFVAAFAEVVAGNDALRPRSAADFADYVLGHLPVFPSEYVEIKRVNIGLVEVDDTRAGELELGKNICALGS